MLHLISSESAWWKDYKQQILEPDFGVPDEMNEFDDFWLTYKQTQFEDTSEGVCNS